MVGAGLCAGPGAAQGLGYQKNVARTDSYEVRGRLRAGTEAYIGFNLDFQVTASIIFFLSLHFLIL